MHFKRFSLLAILLTSLGAQANESDKSTADTTPNTTLNTKSKTLSKTEIKAVMKDFNDRLAKELPNPGIQVGQKAPNFVLNNAFGKTVKLYDELKKGPVVLVFYRGAWCPHCNIHLHALQKSLPDFLHHGAQLITISPQKPDKSAEQFKKDGYDFEVLSDLQSKVMKDYNLYFELSDELLAVYKHFDIDVEAHNGQGRTVLPVPGSFVIDQDGIVRAMQAQTNYKERMAPAAIVSALKQISATF